MSNFIKKEQLNGSQKVVVGEKYNDLVLRTLGRVYIQTGSKMTLIDNLFKTIEKASDNISKTTMTVVNKPSELNSLVYPGDNTFVFVSSSQNLYVCYDGGYVPIVAKNEADVNWEDLVRRFVEKSGDVMTGPLEVPRVDANRVNVKQQVEINIENEPPLIIKSSDLVKNLNVDKLDGLHRSDFAVKAENEKITGAWVFDNITQFKSETIHHSSLSTPSFASGYAGHGWMLDTNSNTLTIDNLVVRKTMYVYELVVNKIKATNGSLWVSDSAQVESAELIIPDGYWLFQYQNGIPVLLNNEMITPEQIENVDMRNVDYWDAWASSEIILCSGYNTNEPHVNDTNPNDYDVLKINNGINVYDKVNNRNNIRNLYHHYFNGDFYKIVLDEDNKKYCPFRVNDIVRCQKFIDNCIKYYDAIVTNITPEYIVIRISESNTGNYTELSTDSNGNIIITDKTHSIDNDNPLRELSQPEEKDGLVRVGNIADPIRQGAIYMTSNEHEGPTINIMSDMCRPDYSVLLPELKNGKIVYRTALKVRLGSLNGIYDEAFGYNQPSGYGLLAENVYLKGRFVQSDPDGSETPMTVYKGPYHPETTYYHQNQVTYEGCIYTCLVNSVTGILPTNEEYWVLSVQSGEGVPGKDGVDGKDGTDGKDGNNGPSISYYGEWDSKEMYVIRDDNRSVVKRTIGTSTTYYQTKLTSELPQSLRNTTIPVGEYPNNSNYWKIFSGQFTSIATGVLMAEDGFINVLGSSRIFVGDSTTNTGWILTEGVIQHITNKNTVDLTFGADGVIYAPNGSSIIIDNYPINKYTENISKEQVDNIQIGGINLITNSENFGNSKPTSTSVSDKWFELNGTDELIIKQLNDGKYITISADFDILNTGDGTETNTSAYVTLYCNDNEGTVVYATLEVKNTFNGRRSISYKKESNRIITKLGYKLAVIRGTTITGTISNVKIELGNKATPFSISPQETENKIDSAKTSAINAQNSANAANTAIDAMNDDTIFDIVEKQSIRTQWEVIWGIANTVMSEKDGSYSITLKEANAVGIDNSLTEKVNVLKNYLTDMKLYSNVNTSGFSRPILAEYFRDYQNEEIRVWNEIGNKYSSNIVDDLEIGGINLWEDCKTVAGYITNGSFISSTATCHRTLPTKIPVIPGNKLSWQIWNPKLILNSSNSNRITFYDSSDNYISQTFIPYLTTTYHSGTITVPENATYVKLGFIQGPDNGNKDSSIKIKVERGNKKTEYTISQSDADYEIYQSQITGDNLLIVNKITRGSFLTNTGAISTNSAWFYSDYISTDNILFLTTSGYTNLGMAQSVCYYDEAKKYIKGINNNNQNLGKDITIDDKNIKYIRVSGEIKDLGTYKVEYGQVATAYNRNVEDTTIELDDIASDDKVTPSEKLQIDVEWQAIQKEKVTLNAQATALSITTENTDYNNQYGALSVYLTKANTGILANMTTTSTVVRSAFNSFFSLYYEQKAKLQTAIVNKTKANTIAAQNTANTALEDANNIKTGINLASWSGDFKNIETFNLWKSKGYWTIPSNMSACTISVVNNNLRIDFPEVGTGLTYQPELIIKGLTSGKTYSFFVKYKSDGVVFNELQTYPTYYCAKSLPASPTKFSVHRNTFTCTTSGDIRFYFRRNDGSYPTNYLEIESIMFCECSLDNLPALWSKSLANQEEDADNQLGGVNLFNTVDCQIETGDWFVKNPKWTETGFTFTTGTTASSSGRLHNVIPKNGYYTISFRAKCSGVNLPFTVTVCDQILLNTTITNTFEDYSLAIKTNRVTTDKKFIDFRLHNSSINVEIADLMVEHGTIQHKFSYAPRQLPVSINQKANAILATADIMKFQNQSGVAFAEMFNDPNTGNPTFKAEYIDANNLSVGALRYKFIDVDVDEYNTYVVTNNSPSNIDGVGEIKGTAYGGRIIEFSCTEDCIGKVVNVFNKTENPMMKSQSDIGGCTLITCENGFRGLPERCGSAVYGSILNPEYLPDHFQFYSGVIQLCCVKEFALIGKIVGNDVVYDYDYVIRWVVMNSAFKPLSEKYLSSNYFATLYDADSELNKVSVDNITPKIVRKWHTYAYVTASTSKIIILGEDEGSRLRIKNRYSLSVEIKKEDGTLLLNLQSGKKADFIYMNGEWDYNII